MAPWPVFVLAGAAIGVPIGLFGVGGSSIATPLFSLLGVPPLLAVASPLVATIPGAAIAANPYVQRKEARPRAAAWTLAGALPATIAGALLSEIVGGMVLLLVSGLVLVVVGLRVVRPVGNRARREGTARRKNRAFLVAASVGVGLFTGLLANGGGFLLVPMYLLIFGLEMHEAVGTSLLVIVVLSIPTLVTHAALGHIDWTVAISFAAGAVPTSAWSGRLAQHVTGTGLQRGFGWFLGLFGLAFLIYRLIVS